MNVAQELHLLTFLIPFLTSSDIVLCGLAHQSGEPRAFAVLSALFVNVLVLSVCEADVPLVYTQMLPFSWGIFNTLYKMTNSFATQCFLVTVFYFIFLACIDAYYFLLSSKCPLTVSHM